MEKMKTDDIFRLKDLFNIKIKNTSKETVFGVYAGEELISDSTKIQWTTDNFVKMNVYVPHVLFKKEKFNTDSLEKIEGFAEEAAIKIKTDEIVQFERFGFVRIENQQGKIKGFFAHK